MAVVSAPIPHYDPITTSAKPLSQAQLTQNTQRGPNRQPGWITDEWNRWITALNVRVNLTANRIASVNLTDQAASIAATALDIGSIATGIYRVTFYVHVTQAATTNSSIQVTISWTEDGGAQSQSGTALTGNLTTTKESMSFTFEADAASPINYATTYSSTGATAMQYKLIVIAEALDA